MKHRSRFFSFTQTGFSLIEMMVALTIGLFLLGGVLAIYVNSKQSYRQNDPESVVIKAEISPVSFLA
jgi:type IV pilus assembly protein PilW